MRNILEFRFIVGLLIWIGLISGGVLLSRRALDQSPAAIRQLAQFVGQQRYTVQVHFPQPHVVRRGDLVFFADADDYEPIGFVSRVETVGSTMKTAVITDTAFITFFGNAPRIRENDVLNYHAAGNTTGWVLQTMLPPSKRREIGELILNAYAKNQAEIVDAIRPIVEQSLKEAGQIVKEDLKNAFARRSGQVRKISEKYQTELIEKELVPLIQDEIWPILQEESQLLAAEIGKEVWQEVSVFRFGWRYLYDRSPLPEQHLAESEFKRFVEQKAIPILKSHLQDFVELQQSVVKRVSKNSQVQETIASAVNTVVNDPDVQEIFTEVFQEVFVDNVRLKEAFEAHWKTPQARQAIALTSRRLEPTITDIGISLFGSPRSEITPEFARVLRHRILHKDDRWFTLEINGPREFDGRRVSTPKSIDVRIAEPTGEIPYAAARERN